MRPVSTLSAVPRLVTQKRRFTYGAKPAAHQIHFSRKCDATAKGNIHRDITGIGVQ